MIVGAAAGAGPYQAIQRDGQPGHVEEVEDVEIFELVRARSAAGCDGRRARRVVLWLARDQEVQVEGAAPHIGEDLDGRGCDPLAICTGGCALRFLVFGQHAREQITVARSDWPVLTHLAECVDEEVDGWVDLVIDGRAVDEQHPSCYPK